MHELELELVDAAGVKSLFVFCKKEITDHKTLSKTIGLIIEAEKTQKMVVLLDNLDLNGSHETISLAKFAKFLAKLVVRDGEVRHTDERVEISSSGMGREKTLEKYSVRQELPRSIVSAIETLNQKVRQLTCVGISILEALFI